MVCTNCAGAGKVDRWNPLKKIIETLTCRPCKGTGSR